MNLENSADGQNTQEPLQKLTESLRRVGYETR